MTTTNAKIGEWIELNDGGRTVLEIISGKVELYVVYKSVRRVFLWEEETGDFLYGIPAHINAPELCLVAIAALDTPGRLSDVGTRLAGRRPGGRADVVFPPPRSSPAAPGLS